ncbi:3-polyprenyl-4-hydroxybenzoate decarboxylase [Sulfodiicoccus acidiphilus]|uniref:Anhydromevalonate phosphate decarboxylase n=1 Tax=Sulfodiicoccus acidiphilus TaxID=1670455 RepID=A0A348B1S2_9CREN|nr:UbiD family decarboxylase [Sulfodiicoccus acidiphilus]BBD72124.1 3-polyprenyl-4-hydroxybenzoate decarboxylase [Sulfodiicoccus acidiphilus]GGT94813.1 3-polyprenyl-4-hydroxybenzoate decarboxylase [Sulfodiicoccus acidiphilus]
MAYKDLREYLSVLKQRGLLWEIDKPVVKETELFPLVRLQFRGLPESQRKAFLFTHVVNVNGRSYEGSVTVGSLAASRDIYATGMECKPNEISEKFIHAIRNPIPPKQVSYGPVQENVITGDELERRGLSDIPIPVELPGYSGQVRTTTAFLTKDPDTGVQNAGTYSGQIFGPRKILWEIHRGSDGYTHLRNAARKGVKLDAAIVVGGPPAVQYAAAAKVPYGLDELAVAGAINGEPIEVVKGKTVDLLVPATAEYVIEGKISFEEAEPQPPFGEYTGYMAVGIESQYCPIMEVTAITHRNKPVFQTIISQMPPSESSKLRQVAFESAFTRHLRDNCNLPNVLRVTFYETSGSWQFCIIQLRKVKPTDAQQALMAAASYAADVGKIFVAVDEDIDPDDPESVIWAMSFRMQPARDVTVIRGKAAHLDPSVVPPGEEGVETGFRESSAMLIDATRKWDYPPVALPKREYMERALELWKSLGLPELKLKSPWYGYNLGYWNEDLERIAKMIVEGRHYDVGKELERKRTRLRI